MSTDVPRAFRRELSQVPLPTPPADRPEVTEADLAALPETARRYFRFMDVVGRRRVWSFRVAMTGRFRRSPAAAWAPCDAWQYDTSVDIARVFRMRLRLGGIVPLVGHDTYVERHGRLRIELFGLFPVVDETGEALDIGELVTWLNDAVLLAPSMLLEECVSFDPVDERSFDVSVTDGGRTVRARVTLDGRGAPVDFETDDRFLQRPNGTWVRARWHTPVEEWAVGDDGRPHPTRGRAAWLLPEGELTYVELRFLPETLRYDVGPEE